MQAAHGRTGPILDCERRLAPCQSHAENQWLTAPPAKGNNRACPRIQENAGAVSSQTHHAHPSNRVHAAIPNLLARTGADPHFLYLDTENLTRWGPATTYDNYPRKNRMTARPTLPEPSPAHARHRSW